MTTVPALTTLRLGYKDPLTDTFGAHPLLGAVLDLNDGRTFTLAAPDGFTLSAPRRTLVPVGNIRTQGEAVSRGVYQHNRTARVKVTLGPLASYANLTGALRTLLQWLDAPPGIPFMLQYQAPNASAPSYLDVVGCAHTLPLDEEQWLRLQLEPMEITFLVRPGLKGDRVTLQNLAPNPGFEQGSGPAVLAFSDNFANINAYAVQAGSAPTVASSIMTLAVGARVAFGSPGWSHLNLWQLRFKWVTGLTARFYLHYTDANNHLKAEPTGTSWALIPTVAGVATTIATGAVTLTNGNFYWIKVTQFPWPTPSATVAPPYLTASLFNDSAGAVGTLVTNGALAGPAVDGVTALSGRPQIEALGASLQLGGAFSGVHTVSLFGPGGWQTIPEAGAATGFSSGAWEQAKANTLSTGPVTSFGAARVDLAPAGTGTTHVSAVDLDIWSLDDLVVLREWENIDILLLDAQHQFAVIIENKIDSGEHTDQLRRYQETVERHYPGWRIMCLFLTPEGDSPSDERYLPVSYALICSVLEALLVSRSSVLGSDVQVVIRHYTDMLRRHLVGASEIADLCRRIYQRHQRTLDLIYEHRPDRQATIHSFLTQLIAETPDLVVDYSSKTRIGFHPKQWQAITAFFESGKGRPMLFFELQNTPDSLRLKLFIGPGAQETREYIYEVALAHQPPFSLSEKKLYPLWKMIYTKPLLSQKDYELADDELQQEARKHWATFIHTDLPAIVEQISQAFKARAM